MSIPVIVDHLTCYTQAYLTHNKMANTVAQKLYNDVIPCFEIPATIHHDQGGDSHTTLKVIDKWNGLIRPCWICFEHYWKTKNHDGNITWIKLYMHIAARKMTPLGFHCFFTVRKSPSLTNTPSFLD